MIPDLLGMIFDADVVEMAIKVAMGVDIETKPYVGKQFYATYNIHSSVNVFYKEIAFSDELKKYIVKECIYKKRGFCWVLW